MRIISGVARGVKIDTVNSDVVRPTKDRVKEAVFNIVQFDIKDKTFLDLFGGTGQIGIEAASRGAEKTVIVDSCSSAVNVIKANVKKSRLNNCIEVVNSDVIYYLDNTHLKFDICFLDPPYNSEILNKALLKLPCKVKEDGIIITETSKEEKVLTTIENFVLYKQYGYGKMCINTYKDIKLIKGEV